ncbi:transcription-repair coupling factor [Aerococcaceae bacterium DSM 111020]|nr:transcription-repair coupling factor [Aerococcaceae bacterium DSM 111020]
MLQIGGDAVSLKTFKQPFQDAIEVIKKPADPDTHLLTGLDRSAKAVMIAQLYKENPRPLLIVEPDLKANAQLQQDLLYLLEDTPIYNFPAEESLAIRYSVSSHDHMSERLKTLTFLFSGEAGIVITDVSGLMQRLTPRALWENSQKTLTIGSEIERDELAQYLVDLGYNAESAVMTPGEFSFRGSIVDIYPLTSPNPVRLDFFDTELDSLRYFDPETQESIENITSIQITPAQDIVFPLNEQQSLLPQLREILATVTNSMKNEEASETIEKMFSAHLDLLASGESLKYPSAFLEIYDPEATTLLNYLSEEGALIVSEYATIVQRQNQLTEENQLWIEQEILKGYLLPKLSLYKDITESIRQFKYKTLYFSVIQRGLQDKQFSSVHSYQYRTMTNFFNQMPLVAEELRHYLAQNVMTQIFVPNKQEINRLIELLEEHEVHPVVIQDTDNPTPGAINIVQGKLNQGFELPLEKWAVITDHELFDKMRQISPRRRQTNLSNAERIKNYNELKIDDFVVHLDHGIGQYKGIETVEVGGAHRDFLAVVYRDDARILIPVEKINLIQKYVASEGKTPTLNKMGGTEWAKTKQKVQSTVEDIADELIALYAQREQEKGYAFSEDTPEQKEFEEAFPYVETPDQLQATAEIKQDMEKERPMDRLLVGDVGYGKTEVAMRAIFKAVMDGKQVAFLVPTTILAQQHFNTLRERFEEWPFEIRMLSRFVPQSVQKKTIQEIATGSVSIVVGTHRVLSKDIIFQDLGLLIVDEEQRFGVKHKERLKALKAEVDVLTLTATPIPRTLHMSMIGIRDLSVLETPPNNRFPVQTYVMERNEGAIKTGIERELLRGGQVFYLYNRVDTIYQRAEVISELVPEARIAVAHGRLNERELEQVLLAFIQGEYDVLVTTTIIETGVDIPNANTLFIDNADKMGLSTLYQLRGRVGRTHRVAYAYLMYDPMKQLSEVSEKRLNAIREFTELGSGFKIAMRDLSIRGAGNLLGQQQSGFIDSVGYDMYSQMLKEAVEAKRYPSQTNQQKNTPLTWSINLDAYLPDTYIEDSRQKINIYQRIQRIDSRESYQALQDTLIDRFGEFPDEVSDLLDVGLIRYYGSQVGIETITQKNNQLMIVFNENVSQKINGPLVFEILQNVPLKAQIQKKKDKLTVMLDITRKASYEWLGALIRLTEDAHQLLKEKED